MNENNNTEQQNANNSEEFDIVWLISYLWAQRKPIVYTVGGCLLLAIVIYFLKPRVFTSNAAILPIYEGSESGMGGLKGLASMAGINLGGDGANGATITPDLYAEVVTSTPALLEIMETVPLTWKEPKDTVMTLYEHTKADSIPSIGEKILKYTIMLPFTIKEALSEKKAEVVFEEPSKGDFSQVPRPLVMDKVRISCAKWLRSHISVTPDEEVNIVRISASGETPEQSAELATAVMQQLQTTITEYATSSAQKNLNFLQKRYDETMEEFTVARQEFFNYRDRHRDYVEERSSIERQQLEDKYNLSYSLLQSLQSEVEKSRLKLLAETPVFSIVEPVVQPDKKSSPKILIHLIGGFVIGFVLSIGGLLVILGYKQVFKPNEFKEIYDKYRVTEE